MTTMRQFPVLLLFLLTPIIATAVVEISSSPKEVRQGEAVLIQVEGATLDEVAKIIYAGKSLWFFSYNGKPTAFYGIDLADKAGNREINVLMENGTILKKTLTVKERAKIEAPLGIPEKLGGDTPQAATNLVTNLTKENTIINNVFSANKRYWSETFRYPMKFPEVTDSYGYLRKTGYYSIPHKGTDYRAPNGYRVYSLNRGVVRLARTFTIYGKTVAVDHGLGVVSYYMHLSRINVKEGQAVAKGEIIGLSGSSGYAEAPHLHLSVKINGISIDPDKFLKLFSY